VLKLGLLVLQGELKGFDQTTNIILSGSVERVFSLDEPVEEVQLGLYLVRGDNMSVPGHPAHVYSLELTSGDLDRSIVGELDTQKDKASNLESLRADPIAEVQH
jgi:U6 snRNA-associated Sm-like protein LSm8